MEEILAKVFLRLARGKWCGQALMLAQAEERGAHYIAAIPSLKACIEREYGVTVLDALAAAFQRAEELSEKDPVFLEHAATWLCRSGRDPRPFLEALSEAAARKKA